MSRLSDSDYALLPPHLRAGMRRCIEDGIETGSFLRAVLENDLVKAMIAGDDDSRCSLSSLAVFLHIEAPSDAWGSPAKVQAWIDRHAKECEPEAEAFDEKDNRYKRPEDRP